MREVGGAAESNFRSQVHVSRPIHHEEAATLPMRRQVLPPQASVEVRWRGPSPTSRSATVNGDAVKAVRAAGEAVARVEIGADGKIVGIVIAERD